jgi:hypothetical protein
MEGLAFTKTTTYLNPFIFNKSTRHQDIQCEVSNDGASLTIDGSSIGFSLVEKLAPATPLVIRFGLTFSIRKISDIKIQRKIQRKKSETINEAPPKIKKTSDGALFNKSLNIPVKFSPVVKIVLSGLGSKGNGDGTNSRTVVHAKVDEELLDGRFKRAKGMLLCNASDGSYDTSKDLGDSTKISCPKCLKIAHRWASK